MPVIQTKHSLKSVAFQRYFGIIVFTVCIITLVKYHDESEYLTSGVYYLRAARALELFLQDLIDRSYQITLQSGAKTLNSFHL
jgi:hypothetical protein